MLQHLRLSVRYSASPYDRMMTVDEARREGYGRATKIMANHCMFQSLSDFHCARSTKQKTKRHLSDDRRD